MNAIEIPLGLGMAMAMNPEAMRYFSELPDESKREVINHTHQIHSRDEMHAYVQSLAEHGRII